MLVGGIASPGVVQNIPFHFSLQPLNSMDVKMLPQGSHFTSTYKMYSYDYAPEENSFESDEFMIGGKPYRMINEGNWKNNIINHNKILVGR